MIFRSRGFRSIAAGRSSVQSSLSAPAKLPHFDRKVNTTMSGKHVMFSDADDDKYYKPHQQHWKVLHRFAQRMARSWVLVLVILLLYTIKRTIFPLSHEQIEFVDESVRSLWIRAEERGWYPKFPPYESEHYYDDFPHLSLLEENFPAIRAEAAQLLDSNVRLPHLKDLYGRKRAGSKVYKTDWMTYWFKMGRFLPENCARAPQTAALLEQIPDLSNAFFSVLAPHQHIDAHWGHYNGFLRYHLGLIVPQNNVNQDSFLRIRTDITKNTTLTLKDRDELLQEGPTYYWHEGEGKMEINQRPSTLDLRFVMFLL